MVVLTNISDPVSAGFLVKLAESVTGFAGYSVNFIRNFLWAIRAIYLGDMIISA